MIRDTFISAAVSLILSAVFCRIGIPELHKLKFGQYIREEGPERHQKKSGTPTMGGIMIIAAAVLTGLFYAPRYPKMLPVLLFMLAFGLIGFIDDYIKVVKKHNEGLKPRQKLLLQIIATAVLAFYIYRNPEIGTGMLIPFTGNLETGKFLNLGILFIPALFVVVLGTDNGVNLTDGLDGLCASVTVVVCVFFAAAAVKMQIRIAPAAGCLAGALLGFLIYNHYPAKVFMGDTGSLALGGFVSSFALLTQMPLFIIIVGIIYLVEALSVILQVSYFKATHGKRIFRMAPIHHHFELGGWSEWKVVIIFTMITVIASVIAYMGL